MQRGPAKNDLHTPEICISIVYSHVATHSKWTNLSKNE